MPRSFRVLLLVVGGILVFVLGALFGGTFAVQQSGVTEPPAVRQQFRIFWQAWNIVEDHYVDQSALQPQQMTYGAIQGMLASLGDTGHTRFLTPQQIQRSNQELEGKLEGIGIEVTVRDSRPVVIAPIDGSPAQRAGIRPGDVILQANGQDTSRITVEQLADILRGPPGTTVTVVVQHPNQQTPTTITVQRAQVNVPSVTWHLLPGTSVAHIRVTVFAQDAGAQLRQQLQEASAAGATAIILDLRSDPGGILDEAVNVASQFLSAGNVLLVQDRGGRREPIPVKQGGLATSTPIAVLVNEGTASSAEVVAGAIQDQHRAPIIGEPTFGTGTVLSEFRLEDGSAMLVGVAEWLTPNGRMIRQNGIQPDIVVALPEDVIPLIPDAEDGMTSGGLLKSGDVQLLRALQEVQKGR